MFLYLSYCINTHLCFFAVSFMLLNPTVALKESMLCSYCVPRNFLNSWNFFGSYPDSNSYSVVYSDNFITTVSESKQIKIFVVVQSRPLLNAPIILSVKFKYIVIITSLFSILLYSSSLIIINCIYSLVTSFHPSIKVRSHFVSFRVGSGL